MIRRALALLAVLAACNGPATPTSVDTAAIASARGEAPVAGRHFGAPFSRGTAEGLSQALERVTREAAEPAASATPGSGGSEKGATGADSCGSITRDSEGPLVRVSGRVSAVCQKAGCWMSLQDGAAEARIFMREHGFTVPKDIVGRRAEVEGNLRSKTLSAGFAKHLAEDGGKDPATVDGPRREYTVNATGVRILD